MFNKLRQGSGGTYFISVQQILQKVTIRKTKLCLDLGVDTEGMKGACGHSCEKCGCLMNDDETFNVFHNLSSLEDNLAKEVQMALVYIAGYVTRNDHVDDTKYYVVEFGEFTEELNRGRLIMPGDNICQCFFYSYMLFHHIKESVCRISLCNALVTISDFYGFINIEKKHGRIMCNILFNCHLYSPRSSKEPKLKVLKLSNEQ